MDRLASDVREALRSLARRPVRAGVIAASLALGIGANTAVFSYLDFLLWAELPAREPEQLVDVPVETREDSAGRASYPEYLDLREQAAGLDSLSAWTPFTAPVDPGGAGEEGSLHIWGQLVSGDFFATLGVHPLQGRALTAADDRPGAEPVVLLSHRFWKRDLRGDPDVLGRVLRVNGHPFAVVGVMPEGFMGAGLPAALYAPLAASDLLRPRSRGILLDRGSPSVHLTGRLAPGLGPGPAQESLNAALRRLRTGPEPVRVRVVPAGTIVDPETRGYLLPAARRLLVFVGLLLLISCANVANLLLSGALERARELGVRSALGAGRRHLAQQLLAESLLLSLAGGLLGLLLAAWGIGLIEGHLNVGAAGLGTWGSGWADLRLDGRVLGFTLLLCCGTALLSGLLPALRASARADLATALKGGPGAGTRRSPAREALVVLQVALSVWLLAGTGLFGMGLWRIYRTSPGFETGRLLVLTFITPSLEAGSADDRERDDYERIVREIRALPGAASAGLTWSTPLSGWSRSTGLALPGKTGEPSPVDFTIVDAGYFEALGLPLLQGEGFDAGRRQGPAGVVISQSLARKLFPGGSALGETVLLPEMADDGVPAEAVVTGVVADVRSRSLWEGPQPFVYLPFDRYVRRQMTLMVRAKGDPAALAPLVRKRLQEVRPGAAVVDLMTFSEHVERSLTTQRMNVQAVGVFGVLGLLLAALGVGSAMSFTVSRQTHEIGLRMALGARPGEVQWLVLRRALIQAGVGAALGLAATLAFTRLLAGFIEGVETSPEPLILAAAAAVLLAVSGLASYHPARRAAGVDPLVALKRG
jgi:predicted permease